MKTPWQHRVLWIATIALFAGIPLSKAISSIGVGLLGFSALLLVIQRGFPKIRRLYLPLLSLGIFIVFYLISISYSESLIVGLDEVSRQHIFLTLPVCFWVLRKWLYPRLTTLVQVFIWACTFHCVVTLILLILPETVAADLVSEIPLLQPYPEWTDRLKFGIYTPFLERLNLAYLIGFGLLYLLYDGIFHGWSSRIFFQGIILFVAFVLIGARGAQLAFLGGLGVGVVSFLTYKLKSLDLPTEEYRQRMTSAITVLIIGLIATPYLAYKTVPAIKKRYDQMQWELRLINNGNYIKEEYQYFTSLTRIRAWKNASEVIKGNPILGVGIGDYDKALRMKNEAYNDKVPVHNQNFFLYVWGASGILALVALLFGFWTYLRSFWKSASNDVRHLALAYIIFVILSCMVDAYLKYHIGSVSVMMFLSTMFVLNKPIDIEES